MAESRLLYYITNRAAFAADEPTRRRRLLEKIFEAARAGIDYIQLREKDLPTRELESLAREAINTIRQARELAADSRQPATALLINSRADVAMAIGAEGVHLRSGDISPREVAMIWKKSALGVGGETRPGTTAPLTPLIAVSCHSPEEVVEAAGHGATLAVFAPVFEKRTASPAGLGALGKACQANIPVLALGGVTLSNARSCLDAGAAGIAAIRLFQEGDIAAVVETLRRG